MERYTDAEYSSCLDDLYSSFMSVKHLVKGKHDSEVRQPERIIKIAKELKLIPPREHLIRITGSKGKGTVSRLVARYLKRVVVEVYKDYQVDCRNLRDSYSINHSPSFGFCRAFDVDFYYEALISADSIDEKFWIQLLEKYSNIVVGSGTASTVTS